MFVIAALLVASLAQEQDSALISVSVFKPVIEHAAVRYPTRPGLRVVISDRVAKGECIPPCRDTTRVIRRIPAEVVRQLQTSGVIVGACVGNMGCPHPLGETFVRLGIPYRMPSGFRVLPGEGDPSVIVGTAATDRGEIVHVGIEVLVYGPCPKERQPCEYPDIVLF